VKVVDSNTAHSVCAVCGRGFPASEIIPADLVREPVAALIQADHPGWGTGSSICSADLNRYRARYIEQVLADERGEMGQVEQQVLQSLRKMETVARNVNTEFDTRLTLGERIADRVAVFGGSWKFIIIFLAIIAVWMAVNALLLVRRPFDPYPFILLNLVLSCLAALQAPVIMMSQNRQETKDRLRSEHDYAVNLKAELEIRSLHEKLDHLMFRQWHRLLEIQEIQLDLMQELAASGPGRDAGRSD
jgi:uncharacterized membrane protein